MSKFKVGDRVRRIGGGLQAVPLGFETTVVAGSYPAGIDRFWYEDADGDVVNGPSFNWELAPAASGPVREVTRKEIVSGEYGRVRVLTLAGASDVRVGVRLTSSDGAHLVALDAAELRAAAATFCELADALSGSKDK